jgi:hypothetical protein
MPFVSGSHHLLRDAATSTTDMIEPLSDKIRHICHSCHWSDRFVLCFHRVHYLASPCIPAFIITYATFLQSSHASGFRRSRGDCHQLSKLAFLTTRSAGEVSLSLASGRDSSLHVSAVIEILAHPVTRIPKAIMSRLAKSNKPPKSRLTDRAKATARQSASRIFRVAYFLLPAGMAAARRSCE